MSLQFYRSHCTLLGLLGEVFGMIEAFFQQMEVIKKCLVHQFLSGGMKPLNNAAAGLSVAIQ